MFRYQKATMNDQLENYINYTQTLRLTDTYWEEYIFQSQIYSIYIYDEFAGCFSIHKDETLLTSFFINDKFLHFSFSVFEDIIKLFDIKCAYVVSNDEQLLSLVCDVAFNLENQNRVEMQAYFFDDITSPKRPAEFDETFIRPMVQADIVDLNDSEFEHYKDLSNENDTKYIMRDLNNAVMAVGHIQRMVLAPQWGACGMVVSPQFRKQGVGRSMIIALKKKCIKEGLIPIAGCWYYNTNSRLTLQSCGFASKTRLLKFFF